MADLMAHHGRHRRHLVNIGLHPRILVALVGVSLTELAAGQEVEHAVVDEDLPAAIRNGVDLVIAGTEDALETALMAGGTVKPQLVGIELHDTVLDMREDRVLKGGILFLEIRHSLIADRLLLAGREEMGLCGERRSESNSRKSSRRDFLHVLLVHHFNIILSKLTIFLFF